MGKSERVLLVGWDAADWKVIDPLLKAGRMPALASLLSGGASGTIETLRPMLSPMLWTSIATGKLPEKHGILGFIEPDPVSAQPRPASVTSRQCKAFWNILNQEGYRCNVIGWWPSHPAEPVNGVYVSNMFSKFSEKEGMMPNTVHPSELSDTINRCRQFATDITIKDLEFFVPEAATIDQQKDKHLHNLAALLAGCNSIHRAALAAMEAAEWDMTAVYFDTIDQCSHTFMKFYPPQMPGIPDEYFRLYQEVLNQMYVHHDMLLQKLIDKAGKDCTIILLSDHGFYSSNLRPVRLPNDPASPSLEHSPFGILVMKGKQIRSGLTFMGATLTDIAPSILTMFGLPVGKDMDGRILSECLQHDVIAPVDSWEEIAGNSGQHPETLNENSWHSTSALFQMMELGYIEMIGEDKAAVLKKILDESQFYLAISKMSVKNYQDALPILRELYQAEKPVFRYGMKYAACLQYLDMDAEAEGVIRSLGEKNKREVHSIELLDAMLLSGKGNHVAALEKLLTLKQQLSHLPEYFIWCAKECIALDRNDEAEGFFNKALELDPQQTDAMRGLIFLRKKSSGTAEELEQKLNRLSRKTDFELRNTVDEIHNLDLQQDQRIDYRKYQLIIRLFLEQFHKGVPQIR